MLVVRVSSDPYCGMEGQFFLYIYEFLTRRTQNFLANFFAIIFFLDELLVIFFNFIDQALSVDFVFPIFPVYDGDISVSLAVVEIYQGT